MKQRLYHVDAVNDRTGLRQRQTDYPMPHDEACRFVGKQSDGSKRAGVRFVLVESVEPERTSTPPELAARGYIDTGLRIEGPATDACGVARQMAREKPDQFFCVCRVAVNPETWGVFTYLPKEETTP